MLVIANHRWFALSGFLLVLASGLILYVWPAAGGWALLIPLLAWSFQLLSGQFPFRRTKFDWLIILFVITAAVGYWTAYDRDSALHKFWLLMASVMLYYTLSSQPRENLLWISVIFFLMGVGASTYFFLTHDFVALPRKIQVVNQIGLWIMQVRPQVAWKPIHPNYVAGIAAITATFGFYPIWNVLKTVHWGSITLYVMLFLGLTVQLFTLFMTTSRGVMLALVSAAGVWVLWSALKSARSNFRTRYENLFPILVLSYLILVVAILYLGPASLTGSVATQGDYGSGTRAELFGRSIFFLRDFPFTGGGLNAFPGLYSNYMLDIPFFFVVNSHNLFLDVAIEQGIIGGLAYLLLFLGSVWFVSQSIIKTSSSEVRVFRWLVLFALIIAIVHGMVDDYLYNGNGALLALSLLGLALRRGHKDLPVKRPIAASDLRIFGVAIVIFISVCLLNLNRIRSAWYADIGAVQMARVELAGFPTGKWTEINIVPELEMAAASFRSALHYDPSNQTANYRLGLISMLRQDFESAALNLETAYQRSPNHRGIIKNLGYCYVWLGDMQKAQTLLEMIPEAQHELDVYTWWWEDQGRQDLARNAFQMASLLRSQSYQPRTGNE